MTDKSIHTILDENKLLCRDIERDKKMLGQIDTYSKGTEIHLGRSISVRFGNGQDHQSESLDLTEQGTVSCYSSKAKRGTDMILLGLKKMLSARIDCNLELLKKNQAVIDGLIKGF